MEGTSSFLPLLDNFRLLFTGPTFHTFVTLMNAWIICPTRRTVSNLIFFGRSQHAGSFSKYYRFFNHAKWELDAVSKVLAVLVINVLVPQGLILLAVDDTLCRKRGLSLYGGGMHYDPLISSRAKVLKSWGHDWVIVTLILRGPFWSRDSVWSLPLVFCLYRNWQGSRKGRGQTAAQEKLTPQERNRLKRKEARLRAADPTHQTRPALSIKAISLLSEWFPDRQFLVTADSGFGGKSVLSKLPANVDLISQVHPTGVLYEPAPPRTGKGGRPARKGARLSGMQEWAEDSQEPWKNLKFHEYGLHATLQTKVRRKVLYYTAGGQRLLNVVLTRDRDGHRPDKMFYCTRLDLKPREILSYYAARWSIEVCFENSKQLLGFEDPANRVQPAVERTAPMAMVLYSLSLVWFHQTGHAHVQYPDRPWYPQKHDPSFADVLATLRRDSYEETYADVPRSTKRVKTCIAQLVEFLCLSG
jgi:hypothetical protein